MSNLEFVPGPAFNTVDAALSSLKSGFSRGSINPETFEDIGATKNALGLDNVAAHHVIPLALTKVQLGGDPAVRNLILLSTIRGEFKFNDTYYNGLYLPGAMADNPLAVSQENLAYHGGAHEDYKTATAATLEKALATRPELLALLDNPNFDSIVTGADQSYSSAELLGFARQSDSIFVEQVATARYGLTAARTTAALAVTKKEFIDSGVTFLSQSDPLLKSKAAELGVGVKDLIREVNRAHADDLISAARVPILSQQVDDLASAYRILPQFTGMNFEDPNLTITTTTSGTVQALDWITANASSGVTGGGVEAKRAARTAFAVQAMLSRNATLPTQFVSGGRIVGGVALASLNLAAAVTDPVGFAAANVVERSSAAAAVRTPVAGFAGELAGLAGLGLQALIGSVAVYNGKATFDNPYTNFFRINDGQAAPLSLTDTLFGDDWVRRFVDYIDPADKFIKTAPQSHGAVFLYEDGNGNYQEVPDGSDIIVMAPKNWRQLNGDLIFQNSVLLGFIRTIHAALSSGRGSSAGSANLGGSGSSRAVIFYDDQRNQVGNATISDSRSGGSATQLRGASTTSGRSTSIVASNGTLTSVIDGNIAFVRDVDGPQAPPTIHDLAKGTSLTFSQAGAMLGGILGSALVDNDRLGVVLASGVVSAFVGNLGQAVEALRQGSSLEGAVKSAFRDLPADTFLSIEQAGIGAISSYLAGEIIHALGVDGFAGELGGTAAGATLSHIINNFNAQNPLEGLNLGNVVGSFLGAKLANEVLSFESIGGQLGSAVGAAIGSTAVVATLVTGVGSSALLAGVQLGALAGPVGAAVGAFLGFLAGGLIGSIFGGTPRSGADVEWDVASKSFVVANVYSRKHGSKEAAQSMASSVAGTLNGVIAASGGVLSSPENVQAGNYGMRKKEYVYRPVSSTSKDSITKRFSGSGAGSDLVSYGLGQALTASEFRIVGGDVLVKRAIYSTIYLTDAADGSLDPSLLLGNIATAKRYESYLANTAVINAIIASEPGSVFAAETALTLTRAVELGLTRRHQSDWYGGFTYVFDATGTNAASVDFCLRSDAFGLPASRWIGVGSYVLSESIDRSGQTRIDGSSASDTIDLSSGGLPPEGSLIVNGEATSLPTRIDVSATVYAGAGDDRIDASDRGDNLFGGSGIDTLYGGRLDDWIFGNDGNDTLDSGSSVSGSLGGDGNYLSGDAGNDILKGREGSDWLEGGSGVDTLTGGAGDDILSGGSDDGDSLKGEGGDDQYLIRLGDGADIAEDSDGATPIADSFSVDYISQRFARLAAGLIQADWVGLSTPGVTNRKVSGGDDAIVFGQGIEIGDVVLKRDPLDRDNLLVLVMQTDAATGTVAFTGTQLIVRDWFSDPFKRVEWLKFADGNAVRIGDVTSFVIGGSSNDVLIGTLGNDFIYGGEGNDRLFLLAGDDIGNGGTGNDMLAGDSGNDLMLGGLGNDELIGGAGKDAISGDAGTDYIYGGDGDDILSGGASDDTIITGAGDDVVKFSRGDGSDTIFDDLIDSWDVIWQANGTEVGSWRNGYSYDPATGQVFDPAGAVIRRNFGTTEAPDFRWIGHYDYDSLSQTLKRFVPPAEGAFSVRDADATASGDRIEFTPGILIQDVIHERHGNDLVLFIGTSDADVASTSAIRDSITLKDWFLVPGSIEKLAFYSTGMLDLTTTSIVSGSDGGDDISGGIGADWITGGAGQDLLAGSGGDDILSGNSGGDRIDGGAGNDVLYGGSGDDVLVGGQGRDILIGGEGGDTASYAGSAAVRVSLANPSLNSGDAVGDSFDGVENLTGGDSNDDLAGDDGQNILEGGKGNDLLHGDIGDDTYVWNGTSATDNDGRDVISEGAGAYDEVLTASGELAAGYIATATNEGVEDLYYRDQLARARSTRFSWQLQITKGDQIVYDKLVYGSRREFTNNPSTWPSDGWIGGYRPTGNGFQVASVQYGGTVDGGDDTLELGEGIAFADLTFSMSGDTLTVTYRDQASSAIVIAGQSTAGGRIEHIQFHDGLSANLANLAIEQNGGAGDDLVVGDLASDQLNGGDGNDVMFGSGGDDSLSGGAGDDVIEGGVGADVISGGGNSDASNPDWGDTARYAGSTSGVNIDLASAGAQTGGDAAGDVLSGIENVVGSRIGGDILYGDDGGNRLFGLGGADTLSGRGGDDVLIGDDGDDILDGGTGDDAAEGGAGNDQLLGGAGRDQLFGGDGADILEGGDGDDTLVGGTGGDQLLGGTGNDQLQGNDDNDALAGGDGNDVLDGGTGDDSLLGGAGDDSYVFGRSTGHDEITDGAGSNRILFDQTVGYKDLWLTRSGDDLQIGVIGGDTLVRIRGFYQAGGSTPISTIIAGDRTLFVNDPEVLALVAGMTGVSSSTPASMPSAIEALLDRSWDVGGAAAPLAPATPQVVGLINDGGAGVIINASLGVVDHDSVGLTYALNPAGVPGHGTLELLNAATGQVRYVPVAGASGNDSFSLLVSDGDGHTTAIPVGLVLSLPGENHAPTATGGFALSHNENVAAGTIIGTITGSDPDGVSGELDYSFAGAAVTEVTGRFISTSADGRYSLDRDSGVVTAASADQDYEANPAGFSYAVTVRDRNSAASSAALDTTLRISLGNIDEAHDLVAGSVDVRELGIALGPYIPTPDVNGYGINLARFMLNDPDNGNVRWRFATGQQTGPWMLDVEGTLYMLGATDYETTPIYSFTVEAIDDQIGVTRSATLTINVRDVVDESVTGGAPVQFGAEGNGRAGYYVTGLDSVRLSDGSTRTAEQIAALFVQGQSTEGDDVIYGTTFADTISALAGNDAIYAGLGNDTIKGGSGNDVYRLELGDGQDLIEDIGAGNTSGGSDTIRFGRNITPNDVHVSQSADGADLILAYGGFGDKVTLRNALVDRQSRIESVTFENGVSWTFTELFARSIADNAGNDSFFGSADADLISGGAGNDILTGRDGADDLSGGTENDRLIGGAGNDTLREGDGNDVYIWNVGDGEDIILGGDGADGYNILEFGVGISASDLRYAFTDTQASGLKITFAGQGGSITLDQQLLRSGTEGLDAIRFFDGSVLRRSEFQTAAFAQIATASGDLLFGSNASGDAIAPGDGVHVTRPTDILVGGGGDDRLDARAGSDSLSGGTGNDLLIGGDGGDTYVFSPGDGDDVVRDSGGSVGSADPGFDRLQFTAGTAPTDLKVVQVNEGNDLVVTRIGSADRIVLQNSIDSRDDRIDGVVFANGTTWDSEELLRQSMLNNAGDDVFYGGYDDNTLYGGAGRDTLYGRGGDDWLKGGSGDDVLVGGAGNDLLSGDAGDDIALFGRGAGEDVFQDYSGNGGEGGTDTVQLDAGIGTGDITVLQANTTDLVIKINGTADQITLRNALTSIPDRVEWLRFADGTASSHADLLQRSMLANTGNDTFYGSYDSENVSGGTGDDVLRARAGDDILVGGQGNDRLSGDGGNDVFRFGRGDGQDIIEDNSGAGGSGGDDTLELGAGISPDQILVVQTNTDLTLRIIGSDETVTLSTTLIDASDRIEQVRFADGAVWSHADVLQRSMLDNGGDDHFFGSYDGEMLSGGAGADTLVAREGNDILVGGTGDDLLSGDSGDDVYRFGLNQGHDTVEDYSGAAGAGGSDTIQLEGGLLASDVTVEQANGTDLLISIGGGSSSILLKSTLSSSDDRIEKLRFADGTEWSAKDLLQRSMSANAGDDAFYGSYEADAMNGGEGDDVLRARGGNDVLTGGVGNDFLAGDDGNDIYRFGRGDGQDIIAEGLTAGSGGTDVVQLLSGIATSDVSVERNGLFDLLIKINGTADQIRLDNTLLGGANHIEWLRFADGTMWSDDDLFVRSGGVVISRGAAPTVAVGGTTADDDLHPASGNELVTGGAGNDTIWESDGDDTYVWGLGDGDDVIRNGGFWDGINTIAFGSGIAPTDLSYSYANGGNSLRISIAGQGSVTIEGQLADRADEHIDQLRFADGLVLSRGQFLAAAGAQLSTPGSDAIFAGNGADAIASGAGDDSIDPRDGEDWVLGGAGNDTIIESGGDDTYVWNLGDGNDLITSGGFWDGFNTIEFGAGITAANLRYGYTSDGWGLTFSVDGQPGSVTVDQQLSGRADERIDQIRFSDGSMLTREEFQNAALAQLGTSGNDTLWSSNLAETISAGAGDDIIDPRDGADRVIGGTGNDTITESGGDDTYIWNLGDDDDLIVSGGFWDGFNTIEFGAGITATSLRYAYNSNGFGLTLSVDGQPGSITIDQQLAGRADERIDQLRFSDGSILPREQFQAAALDQLVTGGSDAVWGSQGSETIASGAGADVIDPREGNDQIIGGTGDDVITESGGNDTYVWNLGDGDDLIASGGYWDGFNTIEFGTGITAADLRYAYTSNGWGVKVSIEGQSGSVTIDQQLLGAAGERIDQLRFADGGSLTRGEFQAAAFAALATSDGDTLWGSQGDDVISGGTGADVIDVREGNDRVTGGEGNDTIVESGGDDTYVWDLGDGDDLIVNAGWYDGFNTIEFGTGVDAAALRYTYSNGGGGLTISVSGQAGSITIDQQLAGGSDERIDQLRFTDGSTLSRDEFQAAAFAQLGTSANDILWGSNRGETIVGGGGDDLIDPLAGADRVIGGAGDDVIRESDGDDIYLWNLGDGDDQITGGSPSDGYNAVEFGTGISAADLLVSRTAADPSALRISFKAAAGSLVLRHQGSSDEGVDVVRFADGTALGRTQIQAMIIAATDGADTLVGGAAADEIRGLAGDDGLSGADGNDSLIGGTGNDVLSGGTGDDLYLFGRGDGVDTIVEIAGEGMDRLVFGSGITPGDVTVSAEANGDLLIAITGTTDAVRVIGGASVGIVEQVAFDDGSIWIYDPAAGFLPRHTPGADIITGTGGDDTLRGDGGDDLISGVAGADILSGEDGNDRLFGDTGNDVLMGGTGDDSMSGGAGDDIFDIGLGAGTDIFDGGSGTDRIRATASDAVIGVVSLSGIETIDADGHANVTIAGTAGADLLDLSAVNLIGVASIDGGMGDDSLTLGSGDDVVRGGDGSDMVAGGFGNDDLSGESGSDTLLGQSGNDTLSGGLGSDALDGSLGNDTLFGGDGDDTLLGGAGEDVLRGDDGIDTLSGGDGSDSLTGGGGDDVLVGDAGQDSLAGGDGNDRLVGGGDDDLLSGGSGADTLIGGSGQDVLQGDDGDDLFEVAGVADGFDSIDGGAGNDRLILSDGGQTLGLHAIRGVETISGTGQPGVTIIGSEGDDSLDFTGSTLLGIDAVIGGAGADMIIGSTAADTLAGGLGDDILSGGLGDDTYEYEAGDGSDVVSDSGGDDLLLLTGVSAADVTVSISGDHHDYVLTIVPTGAVVRLAGAADDTARQIERVAFNGGAVWTAADLMTRSGNPGTTIIGTTGNDALVGTSGNDVLRGLGGDDRIEPGAGVDVIDGGTQTSGVGAGDWVDYTSAASAVALSLSSGGTQGDAQGDIYVGIESVAGSDFGDRILGDGAANVLEGNGGNDILTGGEGNDSLFGGLGDDIIRTGGTSDGFDAVDGGDGTDTIQATANGTIIGLRSLNNVEAIAGGGYSGVSVVGSSSADHLDFSQVVLTEITRIDGGEGDDILTGSVAADTIAGSEGNDVLTGNSGNDILSGGAGNDRFRVTGGNDGFDIFDGGEGVDTIEATASATIIGLVSLTGIEAITAAGFGSVTLQGSSASDSFDFSGVVLSGIDHIDGGAGNDVILGSSAADTIVGGAGSDRLSGGTGEDIFQVAGAGDGFDAIDGGAGNDTIAAGRANTIIGLTALANVETITANGFANVTIAGSDQADILSFASVSLAGIAKIDGGNGDDQIIGSAASDTISGGKGADALSGMAGDDVFLVDGAWDGFDAIDGGSGSDVIRAARSGTVIGLSTIAAVETITAGGFSGVSVLGSAVGNIFDFSTVTLSGIEKIDGGAGADVIIGSQMADTILGGAGDDLLSGRGGSDQLTGGDGNDRFEFGSESDGLDVVDGGSGYDTIAVTSDNAVIQLASLSGIEAISANGFAHASIRLSGGADKLDLSAVTLTGIASIDASAGNDTVIGSASGDTISGGLGDDILFGGAGDDIFETIGSDGGVDAVDGGAGFDTIRAMTAGTAIGLRSLARIEAISANGFDAVSIQGSSADDHLDFTGISLAGITRINGGAGSDILIGSAAADTILGAAGNDTLSGGAGDDSFEFGSDDNGTDVVEGGAGLDRIKATAANSVIGLRSISSIETITANGFGNVTISGSTEADTLDFAGVTLSGIASVTGGAGADMITGSTGNDQLLGDEGDDTLVGGDGNDRLSGGIGIDLLRGGVGDDVVLFDLGDGSDIASEVGGAGFDSLEFGAGIMASAVTVRQSDNGHDLVLSIGGTGDRLTLDEAYAGEPNNRFEQVRFVDGTVWTANDLADRSMASSGVDDLIFGDDRANTIDGGLGNDELHGAGGGDVLHGGAGNDRLLGGAGDDTYQFGRGGGSDVASEDAVGSNGFDTIEFLSGILASDITVERAPVGNGITFAIAGTTDKITINEGQNADVEKLIDRVTFADGTIWSRADILGMLDGPVTGAILVGDAGSNDLYGTGLNDRITGAGGNDYLEGRSGSDTYVYASGDGNDRIFDETNTPGEIDVLKLTNLSAADITLRREGFHVWLKDMTTGQEVMFMYQFHPPYDQGLEKIAFADGSSWNADRIRQEAWYRGNADNNELYGSDFAETFAGGLGNDYLEGHGGGDTYVYASGDGNDRIFDETGTAGEIDVLKLTNLNAADVTLRREGFHVWLKDMTTGQEVMFMYQFHPPYDQGLEKIAFADGSSWNAEKIRQEAWFRGNSDGNDLYGSELNDTLIGSGGNDYLDGGAGIDTGVYAGVKTDYSIVTNSGSVQVVDLQPATDGNDGTDTLINVERLRFGDGEVVSLAAPIVLDLDGNGVELQQIAASGASFDWDGDGTRDRTGWIRPGDGIVVFDRDGDGQVSGPQEISFTDAKAGARSDLDGFSAFDSNGDGRISSEDGQWDQLKIWQDANSDGRSDPGELLGLADAGVASIDLTGTAVERHWGWDDNITINVGHFTRVDGSIGSLSDVALAYERQGAATEPLTPSLAEASTKPVTRIRGEARSGRDRIASRLNIPDMGTDIESGSSKANGEPQTNGLRDRMLSQEAIGAVSTASINSASSPYGSSAGSHLDPRLGLITQYMASFGVRSGEGMAGSKDREVARYDYFA